MNQLFRKKEINELETEDHGKFNRILTTRDLTSLGIAAIIGAGIFSTVGKACFEGGPATIFLFIITAIACGFSALCYAEFASRVPKSGSAYTYAYVAFGEIFAWIIGWDLIMEYAIGNITVAISWSGNLTSFLNNIGVHLPTFITTSYFTAKEGHEIFQSLMSYGTPVPKDIASLHALWIEAPKLGAMPLIMNLPALLVTVFITWLVYIGIKESKNSGNLMVAFKLVIIILVILIGFFYINPDNWIPFAPHGFQGVMKGVSAVFFAYIGFDAISTTAEECKNPQRDLPRSMFYALGICTVLYVLIALVLTGMVNYTQLNVNDFMASAFNARGLNWLGGCIALSAVIATTSVLLVFQIGQPRIWMSMSRDGLLPKLFSKMHPVYKTPSFSTIITGLLVGIPALFLDASFVTDLCSIGTLFAFVLVCGGILVLPKKEVEKGKFHLPYINGKYIIPVLMIGIITFIEIYNPSFWMESLSLKDALHPEWSKMEVLRERFPYYIFCGIGLLLAINSYRKSYSLIPVLGLLSCLYLMTELGVRNWERFIIWLVIGLVIYFGYSKKRSRLGH
jgi:APA family basic amino acid/polyamine antiporter